jgi:hypothetical protein
MRTVGFAGEGPFAALPLSSCVLAFGSIRFSRVAKYTKRPFRTSARPWTRFCLRLA